MNGDYEQYLYNKISCGSNVNDRRYEIQYIICGSRRSGVGGKVDIVVGRTTGKRRVKFGNKRPGKNVVDLLLLGQSRFEERTESAVTTRASMKYESAGHIATLNPDCPLSFFFCSHSPGKGSTRK